MKTLPGLVMIMVMAGGLVLACSSQSLGQLGNFTAPLGQPAYNTYGAPYGQMGQPTPSQYGAAYGQLGQPASNGQLLPGYPSNFAAPSSAPYLFNQPRFAQSYFGIPNYAEPSSGLPSLGRSYDSIYSSRYSAPAQVYTPTAPLGYVTNYAQPTQPASGIVRSGRSPLIPH
jgi:hypothetical protein